MEFAKCRSFLPAEVLARNFGEASGLGNLKFVIGQKNGAQWTLPMVPSNKQMASGSALRVKAFTWNLQNGHVDFGEWSC
jgi:hypothetical protein